MGKENFYPTPENRNEEESYIDYSEVNKNAKNNKEEKKDIESQIKEAEKKSGIDYSKTPKAKQEEQEEFFEAYRKQFHEKDYSLNEEESKKQTEEEKTENKKADAENSPENTGTDKPKGEASEKDNDKKRNEKDNHQSWWDERSRMQEKQMDVKRIEQRDKKITDLETGIEQRDKKIIDIEAEKEQGDKKFVDLETEKKQADKENVDLKTGIEQKDKEIVELKTKLEAKEEENKRLKEVEEKMKNIENVLDEKIKGREDQEKEKVGSKLEKIKNFLKSPKVKLAIGLGCIGAASFATGGGALVGAWLGLPYGLGIPAIGGTSNLIAGVSGALAVGEGFRQELKNKLEKGFNQNMRELQTIVKNEQKEDTTASMENKGTGPKDKKGFFSNLAGKLKGKKNAAPKTDPISPINKPAAPITSQNGTKGSPNERKPPVADSKEKLNVLTQLSEEIKKAQTPDDLKKVREVMLKVHEIDTLPQTHIGWYIKVLNAEEEYNKEIFNARVIEDRKDLEAIKENDPVMFENLIAILNKIDEMKPLIKINK